MTALWPHIRRPKVTLADILVQAITEMARHIRNGKARNGLILANGGVLSYQHAVCLSSRPRADGSSYPDNRNHPSLEVNEPIPQMEDLPEGEAVVEVYYHPPMS